MRKITSVTIAACTTASSPAFVRTAADTLAAAMALAVACAPTAATAGVAAGTYGTRDQVRQCAAEQDRLDAELRQREHAHEAHVAELAKLEAESAESVRRQAAVNNEDAAAVREFNQLVAQQNAQADKINQEALDSRTAAEAYDAAALAHNQRCAGLLIRPEDLAVLMRERAHAASAPASKSPRAAASGAVPAH